MRYNNNLFTGGVTDLLRGHDVTTQQSKGNGDIDTEHGSLRRSMTEMRILMLCLISALFVTLVTLLVLLLRFSRRRRRYPAQATGNIDDTMITNHARF